MHFSRLEDETNRRIDRVRKNIMHDVLIYNLEVETEKRKKKKAEQQMNKEYFMNFLNKEQQSIKKEEKIKVSNMIRRRNLLKQQYERQIRYKNERKQKEKDYDRHYAQIEKNYQDYSNEKRFYEIQRMYNRKSYDARRVEEKKRVRTEPNRYESPYGGMQVHKSFDDRGLRKGHNMNMNVNPESSPCLVFKNGQF